MWNSYNYFLDYQCCDRLSAVIARVYIPSRTIILFMIFLFKSEVQCTKRTPDSATLLSLVRIRKFKSRLFESLHFKVFKFFRKEIFLPLWYRPFLLQLGRPHSCLLCFWGLLFVHRVWASSSHSERKIRRNTRSINPSPFNRRYSSVVEQSTADR